MEHIIITIAREYGSGGRLVGQQLAEELGIAFYDKQLITMAAQESGLAEDFIEKMEQKRTSNFLYNLYMTEHDLPAADQVFLTQSKVIKKVAQQESCVIVGRCADYVLREFDNCLRVFVHAPLEWRIKTVRDLYHEKVANYQDYLQKQDKNRAVYYNYFTQNKWGKAQNYHLAIDSSIGIPAVVRILKEWVAAYSEGGRG